jgi:hypothetical protein
MMRDLSAEGLALRAMLPVRTGDQIPFSFLLNANARIEGQGEVIWVEEQGRVAGIRFLDLPELLRTQIQSWLDGTLESPEPEKPAVADTQSFEELREELRAPQSPRSEPPSTKPHWVIPEKGQPEQTASDPEAAATLPGTDATHAEEAPAETWEYENTEFEEQPEHSTAGEEPPETPFEPFLEPERAAASAEETRERAAWREEPSYSTNASGLPNISDILMQPRGGERFSRWQPLDPLGQEQVPQRSGFTLSRAIGIMALLAIGVAIGVYRQRLGEELIWLGEQMAGGKTVSPATDTNVSTPPPVNGSSAPAAENNSPAQDTGPAGTTAPSGATSSSPAAASPDKTDTNADTTRPLGATVPSIPETSKSSLPPAPSSGTASTAEPESGTESGSTEYAHALQLLHNKNHDDLSEAVRLLWISVEKGNPSAELTLAELYWRGEGVARNCDQTRILLSAAARKGNADAEKRLRIFEREGCE